MPNTHLSAWIISALALAGSYATPASAANVALEPVVRSTSVASTAVCAVRSRSAALSDPVFVDLPTVAEAENIRGITTLKIDLSATGKLVSEKVVDSSGDRFLDDEALRSARLAPFSPEIVNCERVAGSYFYVVDFTQ